MGIKTGLRVRDARLVYPRVVVLTPDPAKYRHVHKQMMKIFESYCGSVTPKSIDEAVLNFDLNNLGYLSNLFEVGQKIKKDIKEKIGEWLTVSVGIGPNRFLAKTAARLKKTRWAGRNKPHQCRGNI